MKHKHTLGLDIDHYSMRAVLLSRKKKGKSVIMHVDKFVELNGTFIRDSDLSAGLKQLKSELGMLSPSVRVATALGGKQVYTGKVAFQDMPKATIKKALKYEIRKELPFESSNSVLEYHKLNNGETRHDDKCDFMVAATTGNQISRYMRLLQDNGLKPDIMEALPLTVANSFWIGVKRESVDAANIVLHIGPDISTLVIDGDQLPYFNRLVYFSASELFTPAEEEPSIMGKERERRITALAEEIIRSLSYYEDNFENVSFSTINLIGRYTESELIDQLREITKLNIVISDLPERVEHTDDMNPGHYDVALTLALQAME